MDLPERKIRKPKGRFMGMVVGKPKEGVKDRG